MITPRTPQSDERLSSVPVLMREMVADTIRSGMLRAMPTPTDARYLADVHARLLQRIRQMEITLQEFDADLRRMDEVFDRGEELGAHEPLSLEAFDGVRLG